MNSTVGPIFNEKVVEKWNLWVYEQCTMCTDWLKKIRKVKLCGCCSLNNAWTVAASLTNVCQKKKKKEKEKRQTPNPNVALLLHFLRPFPSILLFISPLLSTLPLLLCQFFFLIFDYFSSHFILYKFDIISPIQSIFFQQKNCEYSLSLSLSLIALVVFWFGLILSFFANSDLSLYQNIIYTAMNLTMPTNCLGIKYYKVFFVFLCFILILIKIILLFCDEFFFLVTIISFFLERLEIWNL